MDRLAATRVFVTVVEQGSLTLAAERLDMSTAMVSRYLAAMEAWLGTRLLHRTTRRLSLTEAGKAALASCRQLLDLSADVEARAGQAHREPSGRLRITCSPSFADTQLAPALMDFQRQHPRVAFTLMVADRSVDLTAERIDLAVRITNTLEPTLITRPLATCRSVLCASPAYLAAHGTPQSLDELSQHRCLAHAYVSAAQYRFRQGGELIELPITDALSTNDAATLRSAVLAGGGLAVLPTYFVGKDLRAGRLAAVLPAFEPEPLGVHAVYLSRQHQPLALRLLLDFLAARFSGAPWDAVTPG